MTKNTIGGKGHKKAKKHVIDIKNIPIKDENEETDYGIITNVLGNGRMNVLCLGDRRERLGHIRGTLYKKMWICKDDVVLVSIRGFQNDRCDIIFKYSQDEIKTLIKTGQIDKNYYQKNENEKSDEEDMIFVEEDEQDTQNVRKHDQENENEIEIDIDLI